MLEDGDSSGAMFDLLLMARRLEEEGFKAVFFVQRRGKPLVVSSHRGKRVLLDAAREILEEALGKGEGGCCGELLQ